MDNPSLTCQTCLRPPLPEGAPAQSQWRSFCKCDRPFTPGSQFSLEVCANCKLRVAPGISSQVNCLGLCKCAEPKPVKLATVLNKGESDTVRLELAAVKLSPETFPAERYVPLALLGDSPRAVTVMARDLQRGTKVAVKCFKNVSPSIKPTFESEVRKNKELNYAGMAKILDFAFINDRAPYVVTEYKDGLNLDQCLCVYGHPSDDVVIKILLGVCQSLNYAQKQGVLHRAVRPGNIIFLDDWNADPSIAVVDFALPKTRAAEDFSSIRDAQWMSADVARNLEYDEKSEVYMMGCIGYDLLTKMPPFISGSVQELKNSHALTLPPRISSVNFDAGRPKEFDEIIERCLEKDPRYRFETIEKLQERLEVFPRREQMQIAAIAKAKQMKKIGIIAAIAVGVAAVAAGGWFVFAGH